MSVWNHPEPHSSGPPAANPNGGELGADDIQIARSRHMHVSATDCIGTAFEALKANPVQAVLFPLLLGFVSYMVQLPFNLGFEIFARMGPEILGNNPSDVQMVAVIGALSIGGLVYTAISAAIQMFIYGSMIIIWLRLLRGQYAEFSDIFSVSRFAFGLIFVGILQVLGATVGLLLFVIPGIILMLGWHFASHVVVDKNLEATEALKASWRLMDGHKLQLVLLGLLFLPIHFLALLPCGLGLLVTMPLQLGSITAFYDTLAEPGNAYLSPDEYAHQEEMNDIFS